MQCTCTNPEKRAALCRSFGVLIHELITAEIPRRGKLRELKCASFSCFTSHAILVHALLLACPAANAYPRGCATCGTAGDCGGSDDITEVACKCCSVQTNLQDKQWESSKRQDIA